jgi:hypothetical protein
VLSTLNIQQATSMHHVCPGLKTNGISELKADTLILVSYKFLTDCIPAAKIELRYRHINHRYHQLPISKGDFAIDRPYAE